jgi:cystinosin
VAFNDIVFALHAAALSFATYTQYALPRLWGFAPASGATPSRLILGIATGSILAISLVSLLVVSAAGADHPPPSPPSLAADPARWAWLDVVYTVSYAKLLVTLVKYAPQLRHNARNRSTRGWSIAQVLLDFAGGALSLAQQALDSWLLRDWSGITGNPVKFALGNVSMLYDLGFMTQHYVLYPDEARSPSRRRRRSPSKLGRADGAGADREGLMERGLVGRDEDVEGHESSGRRLD